MKKEYISDVWKLKQKGHKNFEFVDVVVNDDNLLFIDPCSIERWNNAWAIKAMKHINSYFDNLFKAYNTCNRQDMRWLLSHAGSKMQPDWDMVMAIMAKEIQLMVCWRYFNHWSN